MSRFEETGRTDPDGDPILGREYATCRPSDLPPKFVSIFGQHRKIGVDHPEHGPGVMNGAGKTSGSGVYQNEAIELELFSGNFSRPGHDRQPARKCCGCNEAQA
jgi:hypothetical protein